MGMKEETGAAKAFRYFKCTYSMALLSFACCVVFSSIKNNQTKAYENNIPTGAAAVIMCFLLFFLAVIEGGQGCLVGLQPIDKDLYKDTHKISYMNTVIAHKGDNLERYIIGRQFNVVLCVFVVSLVAGGLKGGCVFSFDTTVCSVFVNNGVALIIVAIIIGQLTAQVQAAVCMIDFLNNYFMLFTTYFALAIEYTGLLHSVYLFAQIFAKITGQTIPSNEPPKAGGVLAFYWARVLLSTFCLSFCLAVVLEGLIQEVTGMWDGVPVAASIIIMWVLLIFVGIMEGMQIAAFAVFKVPEADYKDTHKMAHKNCSLLFADDDSLGKFLIGRQICVTSCMFIVAKTTTCDADLIAINGNIFGSSSGLQEFYNTGLCGALVTTILGSLIWRSIAGSYPFAFMSNPVIYFIIKICQFLEWIGVCSASWVLGWALGKVTGWKTDDNYIGKPEVKKEKDLELANTEDSDSVPTGKEEM